jgi:hypothetical protein
MNSRQGADDLDDFQISEEFLALSDGEALDASQSEGQPDSDDAQSGINHTSKDQAVIEKKRKRREKEKQRKAKVSFISYHFFLFLDANTPIYTRDESWWRHKNQSNLFR